MHSWCAGSEVVRIVGVNLLGVFLTLIVTAQIAISVRNLVKTQLEETTPPKSTFPFRREHYVGWGTPLSTIKLQADAYSCIHNMSRLRGRVGSRFGVFPVSVSVGQPADYLYGAQQLDPLYRSYPHRVGLLHAHIFWSGSD